VITSVDPFFNNPTITRLAPQSRWTVSDVDKMPIDIRELAQTGRLRGAFEMSPLCLMPLSELCDFLPEAANHAYALNVHLDDCVVLDIEKTCPPELSAALLALPALYSEVSLSGLGYHLILPKPDNMDDFPIAAQKLKLRDDHGWYEILQCHWVTFTHRPVPRSHWANVPAFAPRTWEEVYAELANQAAQVQFDQATKSAVTSDKPKIPGESDALAVMTRDAITKTPADFSNDTSRYEFSVLGTLYQRMSPMIPYLESEYETDFTANMQAWLLFEAAVQMVPHRSKHDEYRNGMPLLLNAATDLLARRAATQSEPQTANC